MPTFAAVCDTASRAPCRGAKLRLNRIITPRRESARTHCNKWFVASWLRICILLRQPARKWNLFPPMVSIYLWASLPISCLRPRPPEINGDCARSKTARLHGHRTHTFADLEAVCCELMALNCQVYSANCIQFTEPDIQKVHNISHSAHCTQCIWKKFLCKTYSWFCSIHYNN